MFSFVFLAVAICYDINYLDYKHPIPHQEWKSITLADFKGNNNPFRTLDGVREFAFIVTSLDVEEGAGGVFVTAHFHPSRSYVFSKRAVGGTLLRHEMYHFHITEYHARLLRKVIRETNFGGNHFDLGALQEEFREKENSMQRLYDNESYHSYRLGNQRGWEAKIDTLLHQTDTLTGTYIDLK